MVQTERDVFWYLHLTPEQAAMVPALRAALASLPPDQGLVAGLDDDVTMARFLQARDWDIRKSVKMYVGMRRLRAEHGLDSLAVPSVSSPAPHPQYQRLLDLYPHFYHKTDIWGRPVYFELLGRTWPAAILDMMTLDEYIAVHLYEFERFRRYILPLCSAACGKPITCVTSVMDLKGLSMKNFTWSAQRMIKAIARLDQDLFPEVLGCCFVINAPPVFKTIWAMVRPLLEERTRSKIQVLDVDYLSEVTKVIPADNLPEFLGGRSPCPVTEGCGWPSVGPWSDGAPAATAAQPGDGQGQAGASTGSGQ